LWQNEPTMSHCSNELLWKTYLLLTANQLRITKQDSVPRSAALFYRGDFVINSEYEYSTHILDLSRSTKLAITILIDGINEYNDPPEGGRYILEATAQTGVRFLIMSLITYYWDSLEANFWNSLHVYHLQLWQERSAQNVNLLTSCYAEDNDAFEKYCLFQNYSPTRRQCPRPVSTPIVVKISATYCGQNMG
jgi:hypothetical protein